MAFCSKCGTKISDQADFCSSCGANLAEYAPEDTFEPKRIPIPDIKIPEASFPKIAVPSINWKLLGFGAAGVAAFAAILIAGTKISNWIGSGDGGTPATLEFVAAPEFDSLMLRIWATPDGPIVGYFRDGFMPVHQQGYYGYADVDGQVQIDAKYSYASNFDGGVAIVAVGRKLADDEFFKIMADRKVEGLKFGLIDTSGNYLVEPIYDYIRPFSDGLAPVFKDEQWGFVDRSGKQIIPAQYSRARPFSEGLSVVVRQGVGRFVIDKTGNELFKLSGRRSRKFQEGLLFYSDGYGDSGFLDASGSKVIEFNNDNTGSSTAGQLPQYQAKSDFSDGLVAVEIDNDTAAAAATAAMEAAEKAAAMASGEPYVEKKTNVSHDKCGYMNKSQKVVVPLEYSKCGDFVNGMAAVGLRNSGDELLYWTLIDKSGKQKFDQGYDAIWSIRFGDAPNSLFKRTDSFWVTITDEKQGAIFWDGNAVEPQYQAIRPISHGLYAVLQNDKWGIITSQGQTLSEPKFDAIGQYSEGKVMVALDGNAGYLEE